MRSLYKPNTFFPKAFYHSEEARDMVTQGTAEGVRIAKAQAPVRTGTYRDSISGTVAKAEGGWRGYVTASVYYAIFVEFGTEDTPTFATLRRAGEVLENG